VHQACIEARAEAEAAAEQRFAAALAHERTKLAKQASSLSCMQQLAATLTPDPGTDSVRHRGTAIHAMQHRQCGGAAQLG